MIWWRLIVACFIELEQVSLCIIPDLVVSLINSGSKLVLVFFIVYSSLISQF